MLKTVPEMVAEARAGGGAAGGVAVFGTHFRFLQHF